MAWCKAMSRRPELTTRAGDSRISWADAAFRAAILLIVSIAAFIVVPDRAIAYLSLHVAPAVRDLIVTAWTVAAFCMVAYLFVRLQREASS
jgi:hypothetical protein